MVKLTPFGIVMRKLRIDKNINLAKMAERVGVTPAYLSAIEIGKRPIANRVLTKIFESYDWTKDELVAIRRSVDQTKKEVSVCDRSPSDRELIAAFAKHLDKLPPSMLHDLRSRLLPLD